MEWVDVDEWYADRAVLIGDAAHASSPLLGQGGCMAMEDACVLAEVLRSASTVESALSDYVNRRKPRVKWVQQQSAATGQALRAPPAGRNAALPERGDQMMKISLRTTHSGTVARPMPGPLGRRPMPVTNMRAVVPRRERSA